MEKHSFRPKVGLAAFIAGFACFNTLAYNWLFIVRAGAREFEAAGLVVLLAAAFNILFCLLFFRRTAKPLAIFFCLLNAAALYFMSHFNTSIDEVMMLNAINTNAYEASDLMGREFAAYLLALGLLPAWAVSRVEFRPGGRKDKLRSAGFSLLVCAAVYLPLHGFFNGFFRQIKYLQDDLIPINCIVSFAAAAKMELAGWGRLERAGEDAEFVPTPGMAGKKNLIVLVIGESARAKNFSLRGYRRDTNAPLAPFSKDIYYFSDVRSCGTATMVSVPCLLSKHRREAFADNYSRWSENVLDILKRAGYRVLWRENNTGCMNQCLRVETEDSCEAKTCPDTMLLEDFGGKIRSMKEDNLFVVLHQRGSHGPRYYTEYPEQAEAYKPACREDDIGACSREELENAYDNTIRFTSAFLSETIRNLEGLGDGYNKALVYVSDHGESLGEGGNYLHSKPYGEAPDEQTDIPMLAWLGRADAEGFGIDPKCLRRKLAEPHSHDNVFHSALGLAAVSAGEYDPELDVFADCRK